MASNGEPAGDRTDFETPDPAVWGLLVAACLLVLLALGPVYDTNDDPAIVGLLSGAVSGTAIDPPFLGSPLSAALRNLYAVLPSVPWYGLVIQACSVLSAGLWAALIASCRLRAVPRLAASAGLLVGGSYLALRVNFMAAAFSLFLAATAWLWKLQTERREVLWRQAWLGAAMGLGCLVRPSLQWLFLFFALPCLLVSTGRRNARRLLLVVAAAGVLVLANAFGEQRRLAEPGARALATFDRARSALVDIPRDPTAGALMAAGWSAGDYEMALRFGMYDEELYRADRIRAFLGRSVRSSWFDRHARTSREYLSSRFHLLCLTSLLFVLWIIRADGGGNGARDPSPAARAAIWSWVGAGVLALAVTRFPPRAFVPLYLYVGALAILVPPRVPRPGAPRAASGLARAVALGVVGSLAAVAIVFWTVDSRAGRARLEADARALAAAADDAGADAILVPVGPILDTRYTAALAPQTQRVLSRMPPAGWLVATPALDAFLARTGFSSGKDFMRGLLSDPRVLFVVRRSHRAEADWLVARLNERYAAGARYESVPAGTPGDGAGFLFFRLRRT